MKIAFLGSSPSKFNSVYSRELLDEIEKYGECSGLIGKNDLEANKDFLKHCEVVFSTWGMPHLSEEEIRKYLPELKVVFYSAGSVQGFAKEFLNCGVRVFSAFAANAVPVAEYTVSQIILAGKGYYQGAKRFRLFLPGSFMHTQNCFGNFDIKIGLIGLGTIGAMVAERLKQLDAEVYAYDPFCSEEKAQALGVRLTDLETVFGQCDIISNHLANKKELKNIFTAKHFSLMKKYSTFINTGRGDQVNEWALAGNLLLHPSKTAVLDVLKKEYFPYINPLFWCPNAIITPHIAGSLGKEKQRMACYMLQQFKNYVENKEMQYEVTKEMLNLMA